MWKSGDSSADVCTQTLQAIRPDLQEAMSDFYTYYGLYDTEVKTQPMREIVSAVTMEMTHAVKKVGFN